MVPRAIETTAWEPPTSASFAIGSYVIADPLVGLTRTQTGTFSGQDFAGNVGNRILDQFRLTLDYTKKMVYFEPNTRFGLRDQFVMDSGAYNPLGLVLPYNTAVHLFGPYEVPTAEISGKAVVTNKTPHAPYRGAGRPEPGQQKQRSPHCWRTS